MARKGAHGEGSLCQRPNGLWELTLMDGFQSDGRRKCKSFYAKTQKEVKQKARAYQDAKAEGFELMWTSPPSRVLWVTQTST